LFAAAGLSVAASLVALTAAAEPPQGKEDKVVSHLELRANDGERFLALGGFFQARLGAGGDDWSGADLSLHRTRLYVFGNPGLRDVRLRMMVGSEGNNLIGVFDAYAEWSVVAGLRIRAGRFKIPVLRDWVEAAPQLAGGGRAGPTLAMLPGRAPGASIAGELFDDHFEYTAGVFHGAGDVGPFRDGRGLAAATRVIWAPQGRSLEGEIDFEDTPTTAVFGLSALAAGWLRPSGLEETSGVESPRPTPIASTANTPGTRSLLGIEALLRSHSWDFGGELFGGVETLEQRTTRVGAYVRTERFFAASNTSVGARVSRLVERVAGRGEADGESVAELDGAIYLRRQELKVVADAGVLHRDSRRRIAPLGRLQLQAMF
jgi:hypothetical protein